jgi:hypothetical protein
MSTEGVRHAHSAGDSERARFEWATTTTGFALAPASVIDAFGGFARDDLWWSEGRGASHWLFVQTGGVGSGFRAYDKPGRRHLTHESLVSEFKHQSDAGTSRSAIS